jgi:hypothetical protein
MDGGDDARYKYIGDHRPVVIKLKFEIPQEDEN